LRLRGLTEKYALRRAVARYLPREIRERGKVPYRAPIGEVFFGGDRGSDARELLSRERIADAGLLDPQAVGRLVAKFESTRGAAVGETDEMALVGSLSLMILHERLVARPRLAEPLEATRFVDGGEVLVDRHAVAEAV
jgi:asparagine synthase (glutamine-hydrolysing)